MDADSSRWRETHALLRQVLTEQHAMRSEIADLRRELRGSRVLSRHDCAKLGRVLPDIAGVLGSQLFLSSEAIEHPSPAIRLACGDLTSQRLGKLLVHAPELGPPQVP